jgi:hypothetical protein
VLPEYFIGADARVNFLHRSKLGGSMNAQAKTPLKILLGMVLLLLALAILIPNLLRSRMAADPPPGATGAWYVRTINTSQVTYSMTYEKVGYAPNLSRLGGWPEGPCSSEQACLLDRILGCPEGTGLAWCTQGLYRYNVQSSSTMPPYKDYWVTATPVESASELKTYCWSSAEPGMRFIKITPLAKPFTLEECLAVPYDPDSYH